MLKSSFAWCIAFLSCASLLYAQEMNSTNYQIVSDSINIGGGYSTSTSFQIQDSGGEIATGFSSSTNYNLYAGYQQQESGDVALTPASDVVMSPSIGGVTGGTSNGSTVFTVTTSNSAGYIVTIRASSSPALISVNDTVADYTPATADPDYTFSIASNASEFGFSPEGADVPDRYKDNGVSCNTGTGETAGACWDPLLVTDRTIVERTSANAPLGTDTTIRFRVAVGSSRNQGEGVYVATTTITALPI